MKDVADLLRAYVGDDRLPALLDDLAISETATSNRLWAEFVRRLRRAAGLPDRDLPDEPRLLLDLMGDEHA